jgi:5-methyltetrahydropteroyltriglutamate--homocysteine methyltransferase
MVRGMAKSSGEIKVTHVGSLVRPDEVVAMMRRFDRGEPVDPDEQHAVLGPAVREFVRRQREA